MVKIVSPTLRWFITLVLVAYFLIAFVVLGTKYILLPNIGYLRPTIESYISKESGAKVAIGNIDIKWRGINPQILLENVLIQDQNNNNLLSIPHTAAVLSWSGLPGLRLKLESLSMQGLDISVQRKSDNSILLIGQQISQNNSANTDKPAASVVSWLLSQRHIVLSNSVIRWQDDTKHSKALVLDQINLNLVNHDGQHRMAITARPLLGKGGTLDLRAKFLANNKAEVYIHLEGLSPKVWQPWLDWPGYFDTDQTSAKLWVMLENGVAGDIYSDISLRNGVWQASNASNVYADYIRIYAHTTWQALKHLPMAPDPVPNNAHPFNNQNNIFDFKVQAKNVRLELNNVYNEELTINAFSGGGQFKHSTLGLSVALNNILIENNDLQIKSNLIWQGNGADPGSIDLTAEIPFATLESMYKYLPKAVDEDVHNWIKPGLAGGYVDNGLMVLRGNLSDFPFDQSNQNSEFIIKLPYKNARLNYAPPDLKDAGWPMLHNMQGRITVRGNNMHIYADTANISTYNNSVVQLTDVDALISDLTGATILSVNGNTSANAQAYFDFVKVSPLGQALNGMFDQTKAKGTWEVPVNLVMPLTGEFSVAVDGAIQMANTSLKFAADIPEFTNANGTISFTHDTAEAKDVSAQFMGGPVSVSGGAGGHLKSIQLKGQLNVDELTQMAGLSGMQRFAGVLPYTASLSGLQVAQSSVPVLHIKSDLKGLSIDLPEPLGKHPNQPLNADLSWQYGTHEGVRSLSLSLGDVLSARFMRDPRKHNSSYFYSGAVAVGANLPVSNNGTEIHVNYSGFNADHWVSAIKEFDSSNNKNHSSVVFPQVTSLLIEADRGYLLGLELDFLNYFLRYQGGNNWRADLVSAQASGVISWQEHGGVIQGPLKAVFSNLAIGRDAAYDAIEDIENSASKLTQQKIEVSDELYVPAIELSIDNLILYGYKLGSLQLSGINKDKGHKWALTNLQLDGKSLRLNGDGVWNLRGLNRGLTLNATAEIDNLGDYADQLGLHNLITEGSGAIKSSVIWHDLPWTLNKSNLMGQIEFDLKKGRLNTINSRSARLLELLSMQSVNRLAALNFNPLDITKEGFPYDKIIGSWRFDNGDLYVENNRVIGPVGTMVIDGSVQLDKGNLDIDAVVVPNLDVSGAAIAAGIAINPLIGLGAFVTQWILKAPLGKAMALQYKIRGNWDTPEIVSAKQLKIEAEQ